MIEIRVDTRDAERFLDSIQKKQIPYASMIALNNVAFRVLKEGREHIQARLDRPTRWPIQSWYVRRKATKQSLMAVVGWSDFLAQKRLAPGNTGSDPEWYLSQQWNGGGRKHKAFERQLIRARLMPADRFAVPGEAAEEMNMMDRHGNMKPGVIVAILSAIGSFDEAGYTANATVRQSKRLSASKAAKKNVYWAGSPGKNTPNGIWALDENYGNGRGRLRPVMIFVRSPQYKKRLDLERIVRRARDKYLPDEFRKALQHAIRTAR